MSVDSQPISVWLKLAAQGDRSALDSVFSALYPELRRVAHARLYSQGRGDGMGTTTLVHETFLKLVQASQLRLEDRRHFFTYAAKTMRNLIVDEARAANAQRRGGGAEHVTLGDTDLLGAPTADGLGQDELLSVHQALEGLQRLDEELTELVELRYFGGYAESEIAELLGVTERTVRRRWDKARSYLLLALRGELR